MLDFRIQTFLTLCETLSYTKTAALLHITQPTVTQHIQFLENEYGCKLFCYSRKSLSLTERGSCCAAVHWGCAPAASGRCGCCARRAPTGGGCVSGPPCPLENTSCPPCWKDTSHSTRRTRCR